MEARDREGLAFQGGRFYLLPAIPWKGGEFPDFTELFDTLFSGFVVVPSMFTFNQQS